MSKHVGYGSHHQLMYFNTKSSSLRYVYHSISIYFRSEI